MVADLICTHLQIVPNYLMKKKTIKFNNKESIAKISDLNNMQVGIARQNIKLVALVESGWRK